MTNNILYASKDFYFLRSKSYCLSMTEESSINNNLCLCGCGESCNNRFVYGHNRRGIRKYSDYKLIPCVCGCGEMIINRDKYNSLRKYKKGHYNKGKDFSGSNNPSWKGGRYKISIGYIMIWNPEHPNCNKDGYILEHRLTMEKHLGRYLDPKEVVHHIDCDRANNKIENLQLFESNGIHLKMELKGKKKH